MKKNIYKLKNIDCAVCASKVEDALNNSDGVESSSLNFIVLKLFVNFDENIISDAEIEKIIHKSLRGVKIVSKNNIPFEDDYIEESVFKKILFKGRK